MKARILFLTILAVVLAGAAMAQQTTSAAVNAPYAGATITDFKGKVSVQLPSQALSSPLRGEVLPPETTVSTEEGRLLLKLSDGSDILVRPHTKLVLKQPETSGWRYLQLMLGRIHSEIQKHLGGTPPLQIGTPSAVISVRGTRFDVEVNERGITEVDVEDGVVELDSLGGRGEPVILTAGFSSRVGMDTAPEPARPTHDWRPELDRPKHHEDHDRGDDDGIRRLEASDRDRHDLSGDHGGGDSSGSGSGSTSGDSGDQKSGSDSGSRSGSDTSDGDRRSSGGKPPDML